jgi:alkanesulfonate monooxygenase SsuD/methylene tetrahydromethanopterin reductase-like flavin-dependent oxidoreductase (luciferase family)
MTDYGHDLRLGVMLEPGADWGREVLPLAELSEQAGLDLVSLPDHPYWTKWLDTMTLLAAIVARTSRVTVLSNLANLPLRPPVTLARTAATLDILSGGRFELGLGTGAQQLLDHISADGGPRRSAGESVQALDEAMQVIRKLWSGDGDVRFDGKHYRLAGTAAGPRPAHDIGIWTGAYQPRMLRLVGRTADGWVPSSPFLPPESLPQASRIIDEAAAEAGRSPRDVVRVYNIEGTFSAAGGGFLNGPPGAWAEQLAALTLSQGISVYILHRAGSADFIRQFAAEVAPAVRQIVARERGSRHPGVSAPAQA